MIENSDNILDCDFCINLGILRICMDCCGYNPNCKFYESYNTRLKLIESLEKD